MPEPTLMLLPTETLSGNLLTKISSIELVTPTTLILFARATREVVTPILNESVKFCIDVLKPETNTKSWLFNSIKGL